MENSQDLLHRLPDMKKCSKEFNDTLKSFMPLKGKTICVAFSGGADSVCLLYLLKSVKDEYGFNLIAAHVNHH
jgi:tRNA(Ile)-lysidine synthase TilS/MesJ